MEGAKTSRELPGIVDQIVTMHPAGRHERCGEAGARWLCRLPGWIRLR